MALDADRLKASILDGILENDIKDPNGTWEKVSHAIAQAVVAEITTYAEVSVPAGSIGPGLVAVGAGPAAAPNPAPIPVTQPPVQPGGVT